jgi:hypothetical protein
MMLWNHLLLCFMALFPLMAGTGSAYSSGAGGCAGGVAAVQGSHLDKTKSEYMTGSLKKGNYNVTVGGRNLVVGKATNITTNKAYTITVKGKQPIKGILIRVETPAKYMLDPVGNLLQDAVACAALNKPAVQGITHKSSVNKASASAKLMVMAPANGIKMDITVVLDNDSAESIYYYSKYILNAKKP